MSAPLAAVSAGGVVIVYADAMDRLSRRQADIRRCSIAFCFMASCWQRTGKT
jgi:hypothetical protein